MANPYGSNSPRIFLVRVGGEVHCVPVTYSRSGVATAWLNWSDTVLGRAGGYGYDKEGAALSEAIAKLIRLAGGREEEAEAIERTNCAGVDSVIEKAAEYGIEVVNTYRYALNVFCNSYNQSTIELLRDAVQKKGMERVREIVGGGIAQMARYLDTRMEHVRVDMIRKLSE